jgi:hypothetical protein
MLMMGSVFTCWCFRVRVFVLGGGSLAFFLSMASICGVKCPVSETPLSMIRFGV